MKNYNLIYAILVFVTAVLLMPYVTKAAGGQFWLIVSPKYGDIVIAGTPFNIKWTGQVEWITEPGKKLKIDKVNLSYSCKQGQAVNVIKKSAENNGLYKWNVPANLNRGDYCDLKIVDVNEKITKEKISYETPYVSYCWECFSIVPKAKASTVTFNSLEGKQVKSLEIGSTYILKWDKNAFINQPIDIIIQRLKDDDSCSIRGALLNTGEFRFTLPSRYTGSGTCNGYEVSAGKYRVYLNAGIVTLASDNIEVKAQPQPSVTVTSPNGGETITRGTNYTIRWTKSGAVGDKVNIELWKVGIFSETLFSSIDNNGSKVWSVPSAMMGENAYKIKIIDASNNAVSDMSDGNFSIIDTPPMAVIYPNGGETLESGKTYEIRYRIDRIGASATHYRILLVPQPGAPDMTVRTIYTSPYFYDFSPIISLPLTFMWTVPQVPSGNYYQIQIELLSGVNVLGEYVDISDSTFTIISPSITVTSPNGGEVWKILETRNITWNFTAGTGSIVTIKLFKAGNLLKIISATAPNTGSFSWTIPITYGTNTNDYKITITDNSNSSIFDSSDNYFKIAPAPISKEEKGFFSSFIEAIKRLFGR